MTDSAHTTPVPPDQQRENLLDAQRKAHQDEPRNFKEDALDDKVVSIEPDGTGPSSTETMDPDVDRDKGSGNPTGAG
ncbi:MAG: hypothetical protein ACK4PH_20170 [Aquincola tertiaricarbonis]|uniref:hypothetical protein n=1 Tax=Aquincola TaxID=391952 RepID=UPI00061532F5|nr:MULTISPECIES: hypothetical protein [Aquincola]MCR5867493.1 hypothetical protein [Aquincola sp. J276]